MKVNLTRCSSEELSDAGSTCRWHRKALDDGGFYAPEPSVVLYLLLIMAVAVAGFVVVFGLTYLLPALNPPLLAVAQYMMLRPLLQQVRQLGDVGSDPPGLVAGHSPPLPRARRETCQSYRYLCENPQG
jgi:hypothetical protein